MSFWLLFSAFWALTSATRLALLVPFRGVLYVTGLLGLSLHTKVQTHFHIWTPKTVCPEVGNVVSKIIQAVCEMCGTVQR